LDLRYLQPSSLAYRLHSFRDFCCFKLDNLPASNAGEVIVVTFLDSLKMAMIFPQSIFFYQPCFFQQCQGSINSREADTIILLFCFLKYHNCIWVAWILFQDIQYQQPLAGQVIASMAKSVDQVQIDVHWRVIENENYSQLYKYLIWLCSDECHKYGIVIGEAFEAVICAYCAENHRLTVYRDSSTVIPCPAPLSRLRRYIIKL
jgi:hypothetical protein